MWESQLPLAWLTCLRPWGGCSPYPESCGACSHHVVEVTLACWFCAGGSCLALDTRCDGQAHVNEKRRLGSILSVQSGCHESDVECPSVCLISKRNETVGTKEHRCAPSDSRDKEPNVQKLCLCGERTPAELLFNLTYVCSFGFLGTLFRRGLPCTSFELCNSFHFLSKFLQKYFKYFKDCGVRI